MLKTIKDMLLDSLLLVNLVNALIYWGLSVLVGMPIIIYAYLVYLLVSMAANAILPYIGKVNLIHFTTVEDYESIAVNGFNPPREEAKREENVRGAFGQLGLDRVSACFLKTTPYRTMREKDGRNATIVATYFKAPVTRAEITTATLTRLGMDWTYGNSIETTTDRKLINQAIATDGISLVKPASFYSWKHAVIIMASIQPKLSINRYLATLRLKRAL